MTAAVPPEEPDWTDQVTDLVVGVVDSVREKTTGPILTVSRAVVYGLVAAVTGGVLFVVLTIALIRVLAHFIPGPVWMVYVVAGLVFCLTGLFAWSKRQPSRA